VLKLSVRDLRAHAARYTLTFLAVAIGVAFISGVNTLTDTITKTFDDLFASANEGIDVWVRGVSPFDESSAQLGGVLPRPQIDPVLVDEVRQVDGVFEAAGQIEGYARLIDKDGEPWGGGSFETTVGRNWIENDQLNPFELMEGGHAPQGAREVVIDKDSADGTGYQVGDEAQVQTNRGVSDVRIVGIAKFGDADSPAGVSFVMFDDAAALDLLATDTQGLAGIGVVVDPAFTPEQVRDAVSSTLGPTVEVVTGRELTEENKDAAEQNLQFLRIFLLVFALISVAVGAFVIYTSFSFIMAQRQRQVALLRALGASRLQVLFSVTVEAFLVGVLASVVGYVLGVGLATGLTGLVPGTEGTSLVLAPQSMVIALTVGITVTLVSAFVPSWRAAGVPPVAAMRDVSIDRSHRSRGRLALGLLAFGPGAYALAMGAAQRDLAWAGGGALVAFTALVILGPVIARPSSVVIGSPLPAVRGVIGRLAQQNAARNPKRTASTASALMIGLGIVTLVLVANASVRASIDDLVDNQFGGDFVVDSGAVFGSGGLPSSVARQIGDLPSVDAATGIRFNYAQTEGGVVAVGGLNAAAAFDVFDVGVTAGDPRELGPGGVAVFDGIAQDRGWRVGDTIDVTFPQTGPQPLTIVALLDSGDLTGDYVLDMDTFESNYPGTTDIQVWVRLAAGASPAAAQADIEQVIQDFPTAEVQDLDDFKASTKAQFDPILILINVLLALTVLVAMVGIVNTLVLSIVERRREIGLVRAVGALRGQIRATIRWEALLISTFGMAAAVGVGILFGWVLVRTLADQGFSAFTVPVAQLAVVTAVMLGLTLLASVIPAILAGRRNILEAIATE
jgi:putative ABC transport system permease protein